MSFYKYTAKTVNIPTFSNNVVHKIASRNNDRDCNYFSTNNTLDDSRKSFNTPYFEDKENESRFENQAVFSTIRGFDKVEENASKKLNF